MSDARTVFSLRKEGKLDEALALAQLLFARSPADIWVIRAYGWVLYDKLKEALSSEDVENIILFSGELQKLEIPDQEELLKEKVANLLSQTTSSGEKFRQACNLDRNGEHEKALTLFRELKSCFDESHLQYHNAYGWGLYKYLKTLISHQAGGKEVWKGLLEEYFTLNPGKPSLLHSMMLVIFVQHFKDDQEFMLKWADQFDWGFLRDEDFSTWESKGKIFPGLAERLVQALAKVILAKGDSMQIETFFELLDRALEKFSSNIWLHFYKAKMLLRLGKEEEGKRFVIPVVKEKRGEFWAWALLGDIVSSEDPQLAISCYCNALLCKTEEVFLINTRWSFGILLHRNGLDAEARYELEKSVKSRQQAGYDLNFSKLLVLEESWFKEAIPVESSKSFYTAHAGKAREWLFGDLPHFRGSLIRTFVRPEDSGKALRARLVYEDSGGSRVLSAVRVANHPVLKQMQPGDAITVLADPEHPMKIVEIRKRNADKPFDILPWKLGVVDHVNRRKNVTHVMWGRNEGGLLSGLPYQQGDFVRVKFISRNEGDSSFPNEIVLHELTDEIVPMDLAQYFKGKLRINREKGFAMAGSVFIPPDMVEEARLTSKDGAIIGGLAVATLNIKTGKWGWKAVTIDL